MAEPTNASNVAAVEEQDPGATGVVQDPGATLRDEPNAPSDDDPDNPARPDEPDTDANNAPNEKQPVDSAPQAPNVIFIGTRKRHGKEERLQEAPKKLISGPDTFKGLPSSEQQLEGFYYEKAAELCRAFPGLYKRIIKKGE